MPRRVPPDTLAQMVAYYRARAAEYDEWFERRGRYDHGPEENARWFAEAGEVFAALESLDFSGDVLELAPGTGLWTQRLVRTARSVAVVDAAPEMIAHNRARVASARVRYLQADLFDWRPDRVYDAVCFAFWVSHVPLEDLDGFLRMVATAVQPGGAVFFVDGRREPLSTAKDHVLPDQDQQVMVRRLNDGRAFRIVKNFYDPGWLADRCRRAGLQMVVRETASYFLYATGTRATAS